MRLEVYLQDQDGYGWHAIFIYGSLIQGNQEASPAFCILIAVVQHAVVHSPCLVGTEHRIRHWTYIDDWIIQVPLDLAVAGLYVVHAATASRNLPLQMRKCAFHVPALAKETPEQWPVEAVLLAERISFRLRGSHCLGQRHVVTLQCPCVLVRKVAGCLSRL